MDIIKIDYEVLTYVVIGLFALIGFSRGWLREALTTVLLVFLVLLLVQPEIAQKVVATLLKIVTALLAPFAKNPQSPVRDLLEALKKLLDAENPYGFLLVATVFLLFLSYSAGRKALAEGKLTPLSRLLGGVLGALNGFICMSLVQEYLLARLGFGALRGPSVPGVMAAPAPSRVTVGIDLGTRQSVTTGVTAYVVLALGLVVFVFFIRELSLRRASKKKSGAKPAG